MNSSYENKTKRNAMGHHRRFWKLMQCMSMSLGRNNTISHAWPTSTLSLKMPSGGDCCSKKSIFFSIATHSVMMFVLITNLKLIFGILCPRLRDLPTMDKEQQLVPFHSEAVWDTQKLVFVAPPAFLLQTEEIQILSARSLKPCLVLGQLKEQPVSCQPKGLGIALDIIVGVFVLTYMNTSLSFFS